MGYPRRHYSSFLRVQASAKALKAKTVYVFIPYISPDLTCDRRLNPERSQTYQCESSGQVTGCGRELHNSHAAITWLIISTVDLWWGVPVRNNDGVISCSSRQGIQLTGHQIKHSWRPNRGSLD